MLCHLIWVGSSTFSSRFHIVRTTYWTTTYFCLLSTGSNLQWLKPNQPFVQLNTLNLFSTDRPHQLFFSEGPTAACNPPLYCQPWDNCWFEKITKASHSAILHRQTSYHPHKSAESMTDCHLHHPEGLKEPYLTSMQTGLLLNQAAVGALGSSPLQALQ